jgi:ribosomal protein L11 methyltransferase
MPMLESEVQRLKTYDLPVEPGTITVDSIADEDWQETWKKYYYPTRITRHLTVVPAWESQEFTPSQTGEYPIVLDPGMAFGTGTHATTKLMLQALEAVIRGGETMIDVGTGSGVLAIAAAQLGVADIIGTDIDDMAVRVAQDNLDLNPDVKGKIHLQVSDLLKDVPARPVDIIAANILSDVIARLIPEVDSYLKPGGYFLVSGIINTVAADIENQLITNGYQLIQKTRMGDWYGYIVRKTSEDD